MIPAKDLQELANFWTSGGDAISFYFQPETPTELAHREEPILTKERIQATFGRLRADNPSTRRDIERLLATVAALKGNRSQGRVIFACASHNFWREYDLDGLETGAHFEAANSFTLAPLVPVMERQARYCIALADRNRARLLLLEGAHITEHSRVLDEDNEKVRTTGTGGSSHVERQVGQRVHQHFKFLADHLLHFYEHKDYDFLLIGCRDEMRSEICDALHSELTRILVGQFAVDPGLATREEILERVQPLIEEKEHSEEVRLVEKVFGESTRDGLGCLGLGCVADALERGEIRTMLWPRSHPGPAQSASGCSNCGHILLRRAETCDLCGSPMHSFTDAREALLRRALTMSVEVRQIRSAPFPADADIGALLRFRADRNTAAALAS